MTNYALGICQLCDSPMTLSEIREGVLWEEEEKGWLYGYYYFSEEDDARVAHRRCWKELSEAERAFIRKEASTDPRSMGQRI